MMKKILLTLAIVLILVFALTACEDVSGSNNEEGEHVFRNEWTTDDEKHWRSCIDLSCDARANEAAHTFDEWVVDEEPTCVKEGTRHRTCKVCGKSVSEAIPINPTDHNYSTAWMTDDEKHWRACIDSNCDARANEAVHDFNEWVVVKESTCMKEGTKYHTCKVCRESVSEAVPVNPTAHNYSTTWTTDATSHWHACQNSGCTSTLDKAAHTWDKENTCTVCQRYKVSSMIFTKESDGTYTVAYYGGSASEVIIPSVYNGCAVTSIDHDAFRNCASLTSITIPSSVTYIGTYAFEGCTSLASITIPDSVTRISDSAFHGCTSLTSITIPNSVTSIDSYAFYSCDSLTSITIPDSVTSIDWLAFGYCDSLTSVTIPNSVTSISSDAFEGCTNIEVAVIPTVAISCIPEKKLKTVTITGGTSIGEEAFHGCTSLTSITIPDSVTSIGSYAFYGTGYYDNSSNWENGVLYIGNHLIKAETSLSGSYAIKEGTICISSSAFYNCSALTSITIPNSVTSIGEDAFDDCYSLTSITIPSGVTSIGEYAFSYCCSLTSIHFGGTKSQWESISKDNSWNEKTPTITVTCTDGTVTVKYR